MKKLLFFTVAMVLTSSLSLAQVTKLLSLKTAEKKHIEHHIDLRNQVIDFPLIEGTINDRVIATIPRVHSDRAVNATFFSANFESFPPYWIIYDEDGDGHAWGVFNAPFGHSGRCIFSSSWWPEVEALTPDNWMATQFSIDLSTADETTVLDFWRKALQSSAPEEHYSVYLSTSGNTVADFTGANGHTLIDEEVVTSSNWEKRSILLTDYTGGIVYIAFRHHNVTNQSSLLIDDVEIYENIAPNGEIIEFVAPNNNTTCALTATEDVTITIFNHSGTVLTGFEASYSINDGALVTETVTASIPMYSSIDYTFEQKADLSVLGYYDISASLTIANDIDTENNDATTYVANGDANLTVDVSTGSSSSNGLWYVIDVATDDTIASHSTYQPDQVNNITTVCLNSADCYNFSWVANSASNQVTLSYEGNQIDTKTTTEDYVFFGIGNTCITDDMEMIAVTIPSNVISGNIDITGTVINTGANPLTSFDVVYSIDGGANSATYNVTCNVANGDFFDFAHNVPWNSTLGTHNVNISISNANETATPVNSMNKDILVINEAYDKTVVYEEQTGTWCGFCVRGIVGINTMVHNITDGSFIGIAVHNGDPMTATEYINETSALISGYPVGMIDRIPDPVDGDIYWLNPAYEERVGKIPEAKIEITDQIWNTVTRDFTVEVTTTFAVDIASADYNAALIVVEDSVTGTTSGWDQTNYYDGGTYGPMTDWDGTDYTTAGNPIPAANMVYNHVARQLVGGWDGVDGSIPTSVTYNVGNTYTFNGNLPVDQDASNVHFVAIVIDNTNSQIVNATKIDLDNHIGIKSKNTSNLNIFPNPTTGLGKVEGVEDAQIIVYNMIGQVVYTEANATATTTIDLSSYNAGNYIVKVINDNKVSPQKIVLTK